MGAKPKKTGSAAKVPAKKKKAPARRVPARKAAKSGRAAREQTVEAYVSALGEELAEAATLLRQLVQSAAPGASESIKWGQPVYEDNGPFCYFKASTDHITVGFWRGSELDDPDGRLEIGEDRMRYFTIRGADDVDEELLSDWVRQAVDLNRRVDEPAGASRPSDQSGGTDGDDEPDAEIESGEAETWRSSAAHDGADYRDPERDAHPEPAEIADQDDDRFDDD